MFEQMNPHVLLDDVISEFCYKGTISQKNYMKIIISWSISYISFVKIHVKKHFGSHNMNMLYPKHCYNEACYKGTEPQLLITFIDLHSWTPMGGFDFCLSGVLK